MSEPFEGAVTGSAGQASATPHPEEKDRIRDDLREALANRLWRRFPISEWQAEAQASALIADPLALILAQLSALQAENAALRARVERTEKALDGEWRNAISFPFGQICKHLVASNILSRMENIGFEIPKDLAEAVVNCDDETALAWPPLVLRATRNSLTPESQDA